MVLWKYFAKCRNWNKLERQLQFVMIGALRQQSAEKWKGQQLPGIEPRTPLAVLSWSHEHDDHVVVLHEDHHFTKPKIKGEYIGYYEKDAAWLGAQVVNTKVEFIETEYMLAAQCKWEAQYSGLVHSVKAMYVSYKSHCFIFVRPLVQGRVITRRKEIFIRESVDSLCRDGTNAQCMQYLARPI